MKNSEGKHDLGYVGEVTKVQEAPILRALENGQMPILSSTASDEKGICYNVNADNVASKVAVALGARRLVYLSDVPGLLKDPADPTSLLSSLAVDEVEPLINEWSHFRRHAPQSKQCGGGIAIWGQPGTFH